MSPTEHSVDLDLEYIENVFAYLDFLCYFSLQVSVLHTTLFLIRLFNEKSYVNGAFNLLHPS